MSEAVLELCDLHVRFPISGGRLPACVCSSPTLRAVAAYSRDIIITMLPDGETMRAASATASTQRGRSLPTAPMG